MIVISSGENNNGIIGKTDVNAKVFSANTLTVDMFGNSYYQYQPYKIVTHARVFSLMPKKGICINENIGLFLIAKFSFFKHIFSYNNMCSWEKIKNLTIELPVKENNEIDYVLMDTYISAVKKQIISRVHQFIKREKQTYLNVINHSTPQSYNTEINTTFSIAAETNN